VGARGGWSVLMGVDELVAMLLLHRLCVLYNAAASWKSWKSKKTLQTVEAILGTETHTPHFK